MKESLTWVSAKVKLSSCKKSDKKEFSLGLKQQEIVRFGSKSCFRFSVLEPSVNIYLTYGIWVYP